MKTVASTVRRPRIRHFGGQTVEGAFRRSSGRQKLVITTVNSTALCRDTQTWSLDASGALVVESASNFNGNDNESN
jgi:hypothetical protein